MSDIAQDPPIPVLADPPAPPADPPLPATDDDTPLEARVAVLETKVAALEATDAQANAPRLITTPSGHVAFDAQARATELQAQGMTEEDAVAQAAYEERLWNDRQNG